MVTKEKINAFAFHLLVSLIIALLTLAVIFFVWYPSPLEKATGVTHIAVMLLVIDLIIGPLLTLMVYKKGKKTLVFDITIIVFIQVIAYLYGLFHVYEGKPAWLVQINDRVVMVSPSMTVDNENNSASYRFYPDALGKPNFHSVAFSNIPFIRNRQLDEDVAGKGIVYNPSMYKSYDTKSALSNSHRLEELNNYNASEDVKSVLKVYPKANSWLGLRGGDFAKDLVVLLDKDGNQLAIVNLKPWR